MENVDFYINNEGYLIIPEFDFSFLININESLLPSMPEALEVTTMIPGRDGDVVLSTNYQPISFTVSCFTDDGLSVEKKSEIQSKVNMFLNSMKNTTKKMGIEKYNSYYDVKFNGVLTTTNYPKCLQFNIPFKSSNSFGKDLKNNVLEGNSTGISNTIKEVGALITILGPAQTPKITLNDYLMSYSNVILSGDKLIIDTNNSTITYINSSGTKTNAMREYNHSFPKIVNGENSLAIISGIDDDSNVTLQWNDLKL